MLARIAPLISLTLAVLTLGACPSVPEALSEPAPRIARLELGEPEVMGVDAGVQTAPTLLQQEAIATAEDDDTNHEEVGDTLVALHKTGDAINAYRTALSRGPTAALWQKLGDAYVSAGDTARGKRCLVEALAQDPQSLAARRSLAQLALADNDGGTARVLAEELVRRAPDDVTGHRLLGRAFLQTHMWREAIREMESVALARPDDVYAHNNIGYAALQLGQLDKAREHLERTLSLEPQHGYMMNNLGVTYERLGRRAEAHAAFARAAELDPRYASARLNRERLAQRLTDEERLESAETLLSMRTPPVDGGAVPAGVSADDVGGDAMVEDLEDAAPAGGSARLAPAP